MRAEILADTVGNPLRAGEIQVVFRTEIIGDSGDILPGLRGDIAGRRMEAIFAELRDGGGDKLAFGLFAFTGHGGTVHRTLKN